MTSVCAAITRKGGRCTNLAEPSGQYCYMHDPANAADRKLRAQKGARARAENRGNRELAEIKDLFKDLYNRVLRGELATGPGAVANQILNGRLRAIELERKIAEQEEIAAEVQELKEYIQERGKKWRA